MSWEVCYAFSFCEIGLRKGSYLPCKLCISSLWTVVAKIAPPCMLLWDTADPAGGMWKNLQQWCVSDPGLCWMGYDVDCTAVSCALGRDPQQPVKVLCFEVSFPLWYSSVFIFYLTFVSWHIYVWILSALCAATYRLNSSLRLYFLLGSLVTSNEMNGMVAFTLMKSELKAEEKLYLGSLYWNLLEVYFFNNPLQCSQEITG